MVVSVVDSVVSLSDVVLNGPSVVVLSHGVRIVGLVVTDVVGSVVGYVVVGMYETCSHACSILAARLPKLAATIAPMNIIAAIVMDIIFLAMPSPLFNGMF